MAHLQPQEAEEIWLVVQNPDKLLQMHNREHPVRLYHSLVRQVHRPQLKALQRVVRSAQRITGGKLPALHDTYSTRCHRKAKHYYFFNGRAHVQYMLHNEEEVSQTQVKLRKTVSGPFYNMPFISKM